MAVQIQVRSDSSQAQVDLKKLESSLKSVQTSAESINKSISGLATATKVAFAALPIAAIGTAAIRTAASFETLNARLVTATGSTTRAVQAFSAVQKIVAATPYSVRALTDAYARLATTGSRAFASQAQIERGIQNISDAVAAVGGGDVELNRVAVAFERMASEGRLTAERLNQITDAGIPLTKIADAMGISMGALRKESEKGNLTFEKFYKAFQSVAEAADGFGGAASRQVNTLNGAFSNLGDAIAITQDKMIRQSGVSKILVKGIQSITQSFLNFADGLEFSVAKGLFNIALFYDNARLILLDIGKLFNEYAGKAISFLPDITIDTDTIISDIRGALSRIDISGSVKAYAMKLSDFLPGLDTVLALISKFGQAVKDIFYNIWDAVVGNSYWPDLIEDITMWAGKLLDMVKPHLEKFKAYVFDIFTGLRTEFNKLFKDISIKIGVSANTGVLKEVNSYVKRINDSLGELTENAKKSELVKRLFKEVNNGTSGLLDIYNKLAANNEFNALRISFNAVTVAIGEGLIPRLLGLVGVIAGFLKLDTAQLKLSMTGFIDKVNIEGVGTEKLKAAKAVIESSLSSVTDATDEFNKKASSGLLGFETPGKILDSIGTTIGRVMSQAFLGATKENELQLADIFSLALAFALSKGFRNLVITGAIIKLVIGDQGLSEALSKIYTLISDFGNKVLAGAGISGWVGGDIPGFLAGLIFGGLTLAVVSGKLTPILLAISKAIALRLFLPSLINPETEAKEVGKAKTLGQKMGGAFRGSFSIAGGLAGTLIGGHLSEAALNAFGVKDPLTRAGVELGTIIGTAMAFSTIAAFAASKIIASGAWLLAAFSLPVIKAVLTRLALSTLLLGALFPSVSIVTTAVGSLLATIAAGLSAPVILAALGIAAGGFLLWNIFFGEEGSWGSKLQTFLATDVISPIVSALDTAFAFIEAKFNALKATVKDFFSFGSSQGGTGGGLIMPEGYATGGKISGPGTGTSDSILARLSNGEYVVNAKATASNRGLLERINGGLPAFAEGGVVGKPKNPNLTEVSFPYLDPDFTDNQLNLINSLGDFGFKTKLSLAAGLGTAQKEAGADLSQLTEDTGDGTGLFSSKYRTLLAKYKEHGIDKSKGVWAVSFFRDIDKKFKDKPVTERDDYLSKLLVKDFLGFQYMKVGAGNLTAQDGWDFRGRGWLQYTGRDVYDNIGYLSDPGLLGSSIDANITALPKYLNYKKLSADKVNALKTVSEISRTLNRAVNPGKPSDANKVASFATSNLKKFATGGAISGPGNGTSDSILARLSNGEYVVNAKATANNRNLLERINAGLPAFAQGGGVNMSNLAAATGGDLNRYDFSKLTSQEVIKLNKQITDLLQAQKSADDQLLRSGKVQEYTQKALDNLNEVTTNQLVQYMKPTPELLKAIRDDARSTKSKEIGTNAVGGLKSDFSANLLSLIKGESDFSTFGDSLLNSITSKITETTVSGFTEGLFSVLTAPLESFFSGSADNAMGAGSGFGGLISGVFGGAASSKPTGTVDNPTVTQDVNDVKSKLSSIKADDEKSSLVAVVTDKLSSAFDSLKNGFSTLFPELSKSLSGMFDGLMSILGGGSGGGGSGILGLISTGLSIYSGFSAGAATSSLASTSYSIAPASTGGMGFKLKAFADGGVVPGNYGQATPVIAHAGEVILNQAQQSRVAAAMQGGSSNGQQQVSINITGDISQQTRREILMMSPQIADMVRNNFMEKRILT